jgi:hypothetical protein
MDYDTFRSTLWSDFISDRVVSDMYIYKNEDFVREITFDAYKMYIKGGVDLKIIGKFFESFFDNMFRFSPTTENIRTDILKFD